MTKDDCSKSSDNMMEYWLQGRMDAEIIEAADSFE